jgi:hypothetical protein
MFQNLVIGVCLLLIVGGIVHQIDQASKDGTDPYAVYGAVWAIPVVLAFFGWLIHPGFYWAAGGFLVVALLSMPSMIVRWFKLAPERRKHRGMIE